MRSGNRSWETAVVAASLVKITSLYTEEMVVDGQRLAKSSRYREIG